MATIQVRNIPEDVHHAYRARAAAAGMSLQEYLRSELVRQARKRTPTEVVADVEAELRAGAAGFTRTSSAEVIRGDRSSH